jgi:hypothetical protein
MDHCEQLIELHGASSEVQAVVLPPVVIPLELVIRPDPLKKARDAAERPRKVFRTQFIRASKIRALWSGESCHHNSVVSSTRDPTLELMRRTLPLSPRRNYRITKRAPAIASSDLLRATRVVTSGY